MIVARRSFPVASPRKSTATRRSAFSLAMWAAGAGTTQAPPVASGHCTGPMRVPGNLTPLALASTNDAPRRIAPVKSAPVNWAPSKRLPVRSAFVKSAPARLALEKSANRALTPTNEAPLKLPLVKLELTNVILLKATESYDPASAVTSLHVASARTVQSPCTVGIEIVVRAFSLPLPASLDCVGLTPPQAPSASAMTHISAVAHQLLPSPCVSDFIAKPFRSSTSTLRQR